MHATFCADDTGDRGDGESVDQTARPTRIDDLGIDLLELCFGWLSPSALVRRARRVNTTWAAIATSTPLWAVRSEMLLAAHGSANFPPREEGETEANYYFRALQFFDMQELLKPWKERRYTHLRRLGDISGEV